MANVEIQNSSQPTGRKLTWVKEAADTERIRNKNSQTDKNHVAQLQASSIRELQEYIFAVLKFKCNGNDKFEPFYYDVFYR